MITTLITFIVVLSLLVFVHELGHFVSAKRSGVRVDEFGFGFPPRIFGVKRGGTIYSINWIPLGGFVRIKGESGEDTEDEDSFGYQKTWKRAIILSAGVIMNLVFAWFLLTIGYAIGLPQVTDDISPYATITDRKTQIVAVLEDSPAARAGIEIGDTLLTVDDTAYADIGDFRAYTGERDGVPIALSVVHDGEQRDVEVVPEPLEVTGQSGIGTALTETGIARYPLWLAPVQAFEATVSLTYRVGEAFVMMVWNLVTAKDTGVEISGPVGIAVLTSRAAAAGIRYLLQFTAVLSINLAILNILPIPALDGGRMLFLFIEKLRGKAISRKIEVAAHNLGFTALILLVLVVTYGDVVRFGGSIWHSLAAFFGA